MNFFIRRRKNYLVATVLAAFLTTPAWAGWSDTSGVDGYGTVNLVSGSEVHITGPIGYEFTAYDEATFTTDYMPAGGQYVVSFNLVYNGQGTEGTTVASYGYLRPDDQGGAFNDTFSSGQTPRSDSFSFVVANGGSVQFLLSSQTDGEKVPPTFNVMNFSATYTVPDATPWINAALFLPLLLARRLKSVLSRS